MLITLSILIVILLMVFIGLCIRKKNIVKDIHLKQEDRPLILFDFDGVLCNSLNTSIENLNKIAPKYGLKAIGVDNIEEFRSQDAKTAFKNLGIQSPWKLYRVAKQSQRMLHQSIQEQPTFDGIPELLRTLKQENFNLGLVSANSKQNIEAFLSKHQIELFDFILPRSSTLSKHKRLAWVLHKTALCPSRVIYVGDITTDVTAAQRNSIHSAAVSWGYNNQEILSQFNPTILANDPKALLDSLLSFNFE